MFYPLARNEICRTGLTKCPYALTRLDFRAFAFFDTFLERSTSGLPEVSAREARAATMLFQGKTALVTGAGSVSPLRNPE